MKVEDLILVSIDDHVDRAARHVRAPRARRSTATRPRRSSSDDDGIEQWVFEGSAMPAPIGLNAVVTWPKEEWGFDPVDLRRDAPGRLRHPRARPRHEPQRRSSPRCASRRSPGSARGTFQEAPRQGPRAGHAAGLQRLAHRRVVRRVPRPVHPARASRRSGTRRRMVDEMRRVAAKGCRADHHARAAAHPGSARATTTSTTGTRSSRRCPSEQVVMCLHIGQGFAAINARARRADRQPDHPRHAGVGARRAGPALGPGACATTPTSRSRGRRPASAGSPSTSTAATVTTRNQRWLGHDFGDKLPSDIFREHSLACYVTDPSALKVRHDIGIDIIAWECDYPHSDSIWPDAPEFVLDEIDGAGVLRRRDPQDHVGEHAAGSSTTTRSSTSRSRKPPSVRCAPCRPTSTPRSGRGTSGASCTS